jgi:hypothetical protein
MTWKFEIRTGVQSPLDDFWTSLVLYRRQMISCLFVAPFNASSTVWFGTKIFVLMDVVVLPDIVIFQVIW